MNILLINHYAGSPKHGMEFRPYYLAKSLLKKGHKVTIVGATYSHLRSTQPDVKKILTVEYIDEVEYIWLKTPKYNGNGFGRIINIFSFVFLLIIFSWKFIRHFKLDAVVASSTYPIDIFPAFVISKFSNSKLVFEIHDLWPLTPIELGGYSKWHPYIMMLQFCENFAYRNSDKIISILPYTKEYAVSKGLDESNWFHVPNGVWLEDWNNAIPLNDELTVKLNNLRNANTELVGYIGGHSISNALDTLIDSANLLKDINLKFVLVGNGIEKKKLQKKVNDLNLANVIFLPSVTKLQIPSLLSKFDYFYLGWQKKALYRFGISPNKIFEYMLAAKPIIHSVSAGNDLVAISNCGISVPSEDSILVANAFRKLYQLSKDEKDKMGKRGKEYILENHDYNILSEKFINILKK